MFVYKEMEKRLRKKTFTLDEWLLFTVIQSSVTEEQWVSSPVVQGSKSTWNSSYASKVGSKKQQKTQQVDTTSKHHSVQTLQISEMRYTNVNVLPKHCNEPPNGELLRYGTN